MLHNKAWTKDLPKATLGGFCAAWLCLSLSACKGKEEDAQAYFQEGKTLLQQGNIEQARVQFKNALQIQPKLTEAYYDLALIDEKKQDWKSMYANLVEAVRLNPEYVEAHIKLGQIYLASRQLDKASEEVVTVLKLKPDDVGALTLSSAILFFQGKKAEGLQEVGRALEIDAANSQAILLQAQIHIGDHRYAEALAILNRGIESNPGDMLLRVMKIRVEAEDKNFDGAIADYQELLAKHPDEQSLKYGFVQLLSETGHLEQAEAALRQIFEKDPGEVNAKLRLVELLEKRDDAEAEKTLKQLVDVQPAQMPLQFKLADYYLHRNRPADAQAVLGRIVERDKTGKDGIAAKVKLAGIAAAQNDAKKYEELVEEVLAADKTNTEALLMRVGMRLSRKQPDQAISDLRIVLGEHPDLDTALVMMAQAYQQKGSPDIADSNFRRALQANPGNLQAAFPVAAKMIQAGELDRAEEVINATLKANPANPNALQILAQVRALRKDWDGAQAAAGELGKQQRGSTASHYLSGVIFAKQGNHKEAIKRFQQALQEQPDMAEAIRALVQSYEASNNRSGLVDYLKAFIDKNPKVIEAYNALGFVYAQEKKWDDAVKMLQRAVQAEPKSPQVYKTLADLYLAQKKPAEALAVYRKGLQEVPDNINLMMSLGELHETMKDTDAAIAIYGGILKLNPKFDPAANNLASVLADYRNADKASLEQASKLAERFSESPNPLLQDTYGWVAYRLGDYPKAVASLKKVIAAAPEVAVFHYHLGMAYSQTADKAAAKNEIGTALELAKKQGEFIGIDQARTVLNQLSP